MASNAARLAKTEAAIDTLETAIADGSFTSGYSIRNRERRMLEADRTLKVLYAQYNRLVIQVNRESNGMLRPAKISRAAGSS